mgnify:CR=1 FL=1
MKILVFDIGGTAIKYGICKNGHLEETKEYPTEAFRGGTHILNTICRLSEQYLPFDAIGISTAGQVNPDEGSIIYANSNIPDYTGTQFKKILQKLFHVPVAVENDVNSAALGEAVFGAGKGKILFSALRTGLVSVVPLLKTNRFTTVLLSQPENLVPSLPTQKKNSPVQTRLTDATNDMHPLPHW